MGAILKKFAAICFGFVLLFAVCCFWIPPVTGSSNSFASLSPRANSADDVYWGEKNFHANEYVSIKKEGKEGEAATYDIYISTPGQLACLNWRMRDNANKDNTVDFSGYTIHLENDISLEDLDDNYSLTGTTPIWRPFEIGHRGKNHNIIFDGTGRDGQIHKIIGMKIELTDAETQYVGFFGRMVGGIFQNVIFENPTVVYHYTGTSYKPGVITKPVEVAVGVIAGTADSTYIHNVTINNPIVEIDSANQNGHLFYIGGAVGLLTYNRYTNSDLTQFEYTNTIAKYDWGLESVAMNGGQVNLRIAGQVVNSMNSYGYGTEGYLGGLAGININSKIVNSEVRNLEINPILTIPDNAVDYYLGAFYAGGLAGLTTTRVIRFDARTATGIFNNLITCDVTKSDYVKYVGALVGRVYSGSWVYNNVYVGESFGTGYNDTTTYEYWSPLDFYNSKIYRYNNDLDSADCCLGAFGGLNDYFANGGNEDFDCIWSDPEDNFERYVICNASGHSSSMSGLLFNTQAEMLRFNHHFDLVNENETYQSFIKETVATYTPENEDPQNFTALDLMSRFQAENYHRNSTDPVIASLTAGDMYYMACPIMEYEKGLTINDYGDNADAAYDQLLDAVRQFRVWSIDKNDNLILSNYLGATFEITFDANTGDIDGDRLRSKSGWYNEKTDNIGRVYTRIYEYQEVLKAPEAPKCVGYIFDGWKEYWVDDSGNKIDTANNKFDFDNRERILTKRYFEAQWVKKELVANFYLKPGDTVPFHQWTKNVYFDGVLVTPETKPVSNEGRSFAGWFLYEYLPDDGKDADPNLAWVFYHGDGENATRVPTDDDEINLYAGWIDNFTVLRRLVYDQSVVNCRTVYNWFFREDLASTFNNAYDQAEKAIVENDASKTTELLTDLQNAYDGLLVVPRKLLDPEHLEAYDESLDENKYPFLYDYTTYMSYKSYKKMVKDDYIDKTADDDIEKLHNFELFALYVTQLRDLYYNLQLNKALASSSPESVNQLKADYDRLNAKIVEIEANESKYTTASIESFRAGRDSYIDHFDIVTQQQNYALADFQLFISDFQNVIDQMEPLKSVGPSGNGNSGNGVPQLGIPPIVLGIIIIICLAVIAGGFIGVDLLLNVRRPQKQQELKKEQDEAEDSYV